MYMRYITAVAFLASASLVSAQTPKEKPAENPIYGGDTVHGCYGSIGELKLAFSATYNSQGKCAGYCRDKSMAVGAAFSKDCYCGDKFPPKNTLVDDSKCTEICPGYGDDACGGLDTFTVYHTGYRLSVADSDPSVVKSSSTGASTGAPTTAAPATSATTGGSTTSPPANSSSPNTVGIAVGVVVGILAIASIGGAVFFVLRRRRNSELEEEHRRNAAVNAFIHGGKPPSTSGSLSINDQRLDPIMAQRRASSGSIDDNQDYSRRILRVTNA